MGCVGERFNTKKHHIIGDGTRVSYSRSYVHTINLSNVWLGEDVILFELFLFIFTCLCQESERAARPASGLAAPFARHGPRPEP